MFDSDDLKLGLFLGFSTNSCKSKADKGQSLNQRKEVQYNILPIIKNIFIFSIYIYKHILKTTVASLLQQRQRQYVPGLSIHSLLQIQCKGPLDAQRY